MQASLATPASIVSRASEVDALRCLAMTAVVCLHRGLLPCGWAGVWLFYVISGFVVTKSMIRREIGASAGARLRHFFTRRTVRIVPIYYLYLAVGLIVSAIIGLKQDWLAIASLAGFFDNYTMTIGRGELDWWPSGHLWTISTEMQFYAIYGVTLCLASRRTNVALLIAMLLVGPLARLATSIHLHAAGWQLEPLAFAVYARPGLHIDIFAMGALLAFADARWTVQRFARPLMAAAAAALMLYVGSYMLINALIVGATGTGIIRNIVSGILAGQGREVFLYSVVGFVSAGLIALAAARDPLVRPVLGNPLLQWIGTVSYGAYVYHQLVNLVVTTYAPALWAPYHLPRIAEELVFLALTYPLIVLVAWLSFRYLEMPLNRRVGAERRLQSGGGARQAVGASPQIQSS